MYDPQLGRFHVQDRFAEKYLNYNSYHYAASNPIVFIDYNGDSIRHTQTFMKNDRAWTAYNEWAKTDVGKKFTELFGEGGEYESIAIVFDLLSPKDCSMGSTLTEIVDTKDPENPTRIESGDGKTYSNINDLLSGKSKSQYLRFTLSLNNRGRAKDNSNLPSAIETLTHERQHLDIRLNHLKYSETMPPSFQFEHNSMKRLQYYNERYKTFESVSKYWEQNYNLVKEKNDTREKYINQQVNTFDL